MAQDWTENLTPDEARAALDALKAHQAPVTAREAASGAAGQGGVNLTTPHYCTSSASNCTQSVRKKPPINAHTMTMTTITRFLFFSFMPPLQNASNENNG
jgi:uncharacterized membrane protein